MYQIESFDDAKRLMFLLFEKKKKKTKRIRKRILWARLYSQNWTSCYKIGTKMTEIRNVFSFNFNRETRSGDAPVMCRMRETDNGSVPAERFGSCMACRVRALFRLQSRATGQVLLQGGEALLQERLLQVSVHIRALSIFTWKDIFFFLICFNKIYSDN